MSTASRLALVLLIALYSATARADEPLRVAVSIPPQAWLLERIGGETVAVTVVLPPGASPATFEPTGRHLAEVGRAQVYFAVGVPLESALLPVLRANFPDLTIIPAAVEASAAGHDGHDHAEHDPHLWTDPVQAAAMAGTIASTLIEVDAAHRDLYETRLDSLKREIETLDGELRRILAPHRGRRFYVFHPAWGHFAERYGLEQVAIESGGGMPATRALAATMAAVRRDGVDAIYCQPQFDITQVEALARQLDIAVVTLDPLARDWAANLRAVARQLASSPADKAP